MKPLATHWQVSSGRIAASLLSVFLLAGCQQSSFSEDPAQMPVIIDRIDPEASSLTAEVGAATTFRVQCYVAREYDSLNAAHSFWSVAAPGTSGQSWTHWDDSWTQQFDLAGIWHIDAKCQGDEVGSSPVINWKIAVASANERGPMPSSNPDNPGPPIWDRFFWNGLVALLVTVAGGILVHRLTRK